MTHATQGNGGLLGHPLCYNGEPVREYVANDGYDEQGRLKTKVIPWAFDTGCKSWASHQGSDPVPLLEGWKCDGCRHFPHDLVQSAVFRSITRD